MNMTFRKRKISCSCWESKLESSSP